MECNKDEAVRARDIAVRKFTERDYISAKKFVLKAQNLFADLEGVSQFLTVLDVFLASEIKVSGEIDWYGILGVSSFADEDTIRKQYRKLALNLHPDKNKSVGAEGAFKLVSEAWSLLSDKSKRLTYNQKRSVKIPSRNRQAHGGSQAAASHPNGYHNFSSNVSSTTRNSTRSGVTSVPPQFERPDTFWTVCKRCKTHYEYLRIYLNHTLLCPNCTEAFLAIERPPPPNVVKSSSRSSHSQHQNLRQNTTRNQPVNPGMQWGPQSRAAGLGSMVGSSSAAAQAASVVQQASEKLKRDREGSTSTAEWERNRTFKVTGDSFQSSDGPSKKRKIDDVPSNGCAGYMGNVMGMGNVTSGWERIFSSMKKNNCGPEKNYAFSGSNTRLHCLRELSIFEIRKMLMDKAKAEIQNKLEGWRSATKPKVATIEKEGKKQKIPLNGSTINPANRVGDVDNSKSNQSGNSVSGKSDADGNEQDPAPMIINVPDPDFHNFDMDRTENSFDEDQVWAVYDDDDGMPRFYARIHKVISFDPFRVRISWLNYRSNVELGPIDWVDSGFTKTCGDFRAGKHEITEMLNSFSHKVSWTKGARGIIRIFPTKGEVWAIYRNWSSDWNEQTPDDVIHKYDMVEVLEDFSEEQGVSVVPLSKVTGFRTVFQSQKDAKEVRWIPKEEIFCFSHQVPNHMLTGEEAHNSPKGCRELDPAATPLDLLQATTEADNTQMVGEHGQNNTNFS